MDPNFWHAKWAENKIAFHESKPNPLLTKNYDTLSLEENSRIFLPLCGKSLDIAWLLSKGHHVVGAELSEKAIQHLFNDLNVEPAISNLGEFKQYHHTNIDIFVGDIFNMTRELLGEIDAIYDRAALVALPKETRIQYTQHLSHITQNAPQLLLCYEYDQSIIQGPPFSVSTAEIKDHYGTRYELNLLETILVEGGMKGACVAMESVWHLKNQAR
jgi:thiopurine S-methyltransferase